MRALNVFGAPPSAHAKGTNTRGHSENTRELVILDALTGETFRFPWPLSSSAGTGWKKQQREQAAPTELPVASFWINLEHYVHQLLPTLPCLADETGAARRNGNEAEAQRKGPTISKEPQRCLCFVEATGRSLAAEAAAAAALQEGSRSSRSYENSLAQSNGPLSLILLRPELLACLRHSSRRAPAAAAAVAPNPPSPSHSMAPKASSAVKAAKEQQKGKRDHDILGDAPPIAGGGGSTTCREAFAAVAAAPAAGDSGSFDGTCACSSSGCFSFPSASVQQRLVSGELRALRAAALLDGDASFKVFGNNVVAAAPLLCASRDAAAVAADLHLRMRRQQIAAEVLVRALLRHAELALKWVDAVKLRLQQQARAQEDVVVGFEQVLLKLQQTPLDPMLLLLQQLQHDDPVQRQQKQPTNAIPAAPQTELSSHTVAQRVHTRTDDSVSAAVPAAISIATAAGSASTSEGPQEAATSGGGAPTTAVAAAAATAAKVAGAAEALLTGSVQWERSPSCQDSGREVFAEAVESPSSLPHGSDAGQLFSAASDAPCGSLVPTGAAALARPTPTAAEAGRAAAEGFASPPGEQDPVNSPSCIKLGPRTLGSVGSVKQQQRGKGPAAGSNEADSPTAAAITATENPLGTAVQHLCGSVGSALATAVPAAGAYSKGDPSNSSRATSGTAAAAAQQQNSHRSANPFKAPVAGDTYQLLPFETPQPGPHPDTTHFDASSTTAATVATATPAMPDSAATGAKCVTATAAEAAGDSAIPGPSAASLLNVPAIRSYAASVFADRAAVLQEVELLQQDMRSAASAFRSAADELLSAAAETREALSALLDEQQELTAVHTRAFAAVATAAPAPPIAYSRFAPQQLRALAAEQEAAMEELQQLEQQQRALTKEQRQAWTKHCRQQLQLLCTCLRGRLRLRQYHEQGLACSGKAQRVNAALLQLRRLYACPDAFAAAARETVRRLVFAASFRKAAETARAVLQRMQQQEQQQRLHFLESAAVSLPAAVFWPLLQVAPQEAHVTLPETEEPLTSIIGPAALAATIEEAQQQKQGVEQDQQQRQQQEDRMLLRALLRSELARSRHHAGEDTHAQQQRQQQQPQRQQQQHRRRAQQQQLPLRRTNEHPLLGRSAGPQIILYCGEQQQEQEQQQPAPQSVHRGTATTPWKVQQLYDDTLQKQQATVYGDRSQQFTRRQQVNEQQQQQQLQQQRQQDEQQQRVLPATLPQSPEFLQLLEQLGPEQVQRLQNQLPRYAAGRAAGVQEQQQHQLEQQEPQMPLLQQGLLSGFHPSSRPGPPEGHAAMQQERQQRPERQQQQTQLELQAHRLKESLNDQNKQLVEQHHLVQQLLQQQFQQPLQQQQLEQELQRQGMSANCHTAHARGGGYGVEPQDSKSFSSVYAREQHMHIPGQQQQIQLQQPVSSLQQQYVLQQRGVPLRQRQLHTQQTMQQPEVRPHRRDKEQFPRQQHQELLQHQDLGHAGLNQRGWEVPSQQTHAASGEALQQQLQQQQLQRQQQLQLQHQMEHQLLPGSLRDDEAQRSSQASQQQERRGLQETRQQRPMLAAGDPQQQRQLRKEVPGAHSVAQAKEHRRQQQQQQRQMLPLGSEQQCLKQWMHSTQSLQLQQQQLLLLQQQQLQQQLPFPSAAEQHVEQEEHQRLVPPTISQTEPLSFEQMLETTAVHLHQQNDFRCQQPAYLQQLQQSVRRQDAEEAQLPIRHQQELCGSLLLKTEPSDDPEKS